MPSSTLDQMIKAYVLSERSRLDRCPLRDSIIEIRKQTFASMAATARPTLRVDSPCTQSITDRSCNLPA